MSYASYQTVWGMSAVLLLFVWLVRECWKWVRLPKWDAVPFQYGLGELCVGMFCLSYAWLSLRWMVWYELPNLWVIGSLIASVVLGMGIGKFRHLRRGVRRGHAPYFNLIGGALFGLLICQSTWLVANWLDLSILLIPVLPVGVVPLLYLLYRYTKKLDDSMATFNPNRWGFEFCGLALVLWGAHAILANTVLRNCTAPIILTVGLAAYMGRIHMELKGEKDPFRIQLGIFAGAGLGLAYIVGMIFAGAVFLSGFIMVAPH